MKYKVLNLHSEAPKTIETEVMYEVVSARVDGASLLRLNITKGENEKLHKRRVLAVKRTLKGMKGRGTIQFYAFPENFESSGTEANFLANKFPELFEMTPEENDEESFVYIKI